MVYHPKVKGVAMPPKAPKGLRFCKTCDEFRPLEEFGKYLDAYCHPHWLIRNRAKGRAWREKNGPSADRARAKKWREKNPEKVRASNANLAAEQKKLGYPAHKKWVEENREHLRAYEREYRRKWRIKYPDKAAARRHRQRARKSKAPGHHTGAELAELRLQFGGLCVYCGGLSTTFDHLIPLFRGGANFIWNLAPACRPCNSRKQCESPLDFLAKQPTPLPTAVGYIRDSLAKGLTLVDPERYRRKPFEKVAEQTLWDEAERVFLRDGKVTVKSLKEAKYGASIRRRLGGVQKINNILETKCNVGL
jgi:5-methylcytosine-specific restriction endonuclease McrA